MSAATPTPTDPNPPPPDLVIRVSLVRDDKITADLDPPVWRLIRSSSGVNLDLFQDKILLPAMGWLRNYHTYCFRPVDDSSSGTSTCYIQQDTQASDAVWISDFPGACAARRPEDATIGDLLRSPGDRCVYTYDLGDQWYHLLTLERIISPEESNGMVELLGGAMRCPPEDSNEGGVDGGCASYQQEILDPYVAHLHDPSDVALVRDLARVCFEKRNAANVGGCFRPAEFDLEERRAAVAEALGSRNSTQSATKTFGQAFPYAQIGQRHVVYKKEDDRFEQSGGFILMSETVNVKPDRKEATLCYGCGSPLSPKACARCRAAFYCSRDCQKKHWGLGHKKMCKKEKAAVDKYYEEKRSDKPDPNRFNIDGGVIRQKKYVPGKLRFKVGDEVECLIGPETYGTGKIIKTMYHERCWPMSKIPAPYQIHLDRKTARREGIPHEQALIYSDWDDDFKVRRIRAAGGKAEDKGQDRKPCGKHAHMELVD